MGYASAASVKISSAQASEDADRAQGKSAHRFLGTAAHPECVRIRLNVVMGGSTCAPPGLTLLRWGGLLHPCPPPNNWPYGLPNVARRSLWVAYSTTVMLRTYQDRQKLLLVYIEMNVLVLRKDNGNTKVFCGSSEGMILRLCRGNKLKILEVNSGM